METSELMLSAVVVGITLISSVVYKDRYDRVARVLRNWKMSIIAIIPTFPITAWQN